MKPKRSLSLLLAGLLQTMPFVRAVVTPQVQGLAPSAWAIVMRIAGTAVAYLGSYHAVSGATAIVQPYTINGTVGVAYSRQLTTSGQTAHSWSANTAPLGSATFPLVPGLTLTNSNGKIGGIPTTAIVTNVTISAWENSGNKGASVNAVFTITVTNATGPPPTNPPVITAQPQSQTNFINTGVSFTVTATGTAPLSYQWKFNGSPISNATSSNYSIPSLQTNNAGNYTVTITNAAGSTNSAAAVLTVLVPSADIVAAASGPASVTAGANFNYTVTITNLGPQAASNVVVADSLPPTVAFVTASGSGVFNSGTVTWPAIASLASGGSSSFTVTVSALGSGSLTNTVSANSGTADPNAANNNGTAAAARVVTSVTPPQADISVTCSGPGSVVASSGFNYTVTVSNLGPNAASNVVVSDILPATASFSSATGGGVNNSGIVTWPAISSLAAGSGLSFTVNMIAPASGSFTNSVSGTSSTTDPNAANNNGSSLAAKLVSTVVEAAQADIVATVSGPTNIAAGSALVYALVLSNSGPTTASNVVLVDVLPATVTFSNVTGGGIFSNGAVTWPSIPTLVAGSSASYSLTVLAPSTAGVLTNVVSASSSTPDPIVTNNNGSSTSSIVLTAVQPQADLLVGNSGPAVVLAGSNLTYTISVTNFGASTATNVLLVDNLPAAGAFVSASGSGSVSNNIVRWPAIASLSNGASASVTVTVTAPTNGIFTNTASASSLTPDPNPANNNGSAPASQVITTVATAQGQFGIGSTMTGLNPQSGLYEESVVVTNIGPTTAAAIRMYVDGLRPGVTLFNATGTNAGRPYVQYNAPLNPAGSVAFTLEFYVPDRGAFANSLSAVAVLPNSTATNSAGSVPISRVFADILSGAQRFVIEFATTPGGSYTVIYSDDNMANWNAATPSINASATVTQWFDDGPPKTLSKPLTGGSRFYKVLANP